MNRFHCPFFRLKPRTRVPGVRSEKECHVLGIVKAFDEIEDFSPGLVVGKEVPTIDQFEFEGAPKGFHGGIVVTITLAAHGGDEAGPGQGMAVISGGILDPAIGVAEEFGGGLAMQECHGQSL